MNRRPCSSCAPLLFGNDGESIGRSGGVAVHAGAARPTISSLPSFPSPHHHSSQPIMTTPTLMLPFTPRSGYSPSSPAIILPPSSPHAQASANPGRPFIISYHHLHHLVLDLQSQLAALDLKVGDALSSSLINGVEFAVAFLATGAQRLIAAPLNPSYTTSEVEFYLDDTKSKAILLPAGSLSAEKAPATVQAARKLGVKPIEIVFDPLASDGRGAIFLRDEQGKTLPRQDDKRRVPQPEDVTLRLHTSGTTGRPKVKAALP